MALKSGFYNAFKVNGVYDRKYNADDYSNVFTAFIRDGIRQSGLDDLKVTANGLVLSINTGYAVCGGRWVHLDAAYNLATVTPPVGDYSRIDAVFLRVDARESVREASFVYRTGTAASIPTAPAADTTTGVTEMMLATILVAPSATSVTVTDKRTYSALRSAYVKQYRWRTVLTATASAVSFDIPQYDSSGLDILEVYVNGLREVEGVDYTVSGSRITFISAGGGTGSKASGTEIVVICNKSIDGTGLGSVSDEITKLQNDMSKLTNTNDYVYVCNGINDNVELSKIATAWLNGGTDYSSKIVRVYGEFGATAPNSGSGTSSNNYRWFDVGLGSATNRKITFDFSGCSQINIACEDDTYNIIFFGLHANIIGANVIATGGAAIYMFSTAGQTVANATNCRFWITSKAGLIARGGTFRDCRTSLTTTVENAQSFNVLTGGLLRIFGGEHYAYAPTGAQSSVVYVNSAQANAVALTYGMNCPTFARSNFVQSFAINCLTNNALCSFTDTVTALEITAEGQNIRGTIAQSKAGLM